MEEIEQKHAKENHSTASQTTTKAGAMQSHLSKQKLSYFVIFCTYVCAVDTRWRVDSVDHYLQPKRKRVVSAYMDNHKITSLLRTFEIMSRHKEECGVPVTIRWQCGVSDGGGGGGGGGGGVGGYVGIVSGRGDVDISERFPIGL